MNRPRYAEDFNNWFLSSNGDPWNYNSKNIKRRIKMSFEFFKKHIKVDYCGNIIELGAFNGDFTFLLAQHYKEARICTNDISEIAMDMIKSKTQIFGNVEYLLQDMLSLRSDQIRSDRYFYA